MLGFAGSQALRPGALDHRYESEVHLSILPCEPRHLGPVHSASSHGATSAVDRRDGWIYYLSFDTVGESIEYGSVRAAPG
jgi:hypothetical protein